MELRRSIPVKQSWKYPKPTRRLKVVGEKGREEEGRDSYKLRIEGLSSTNSLNTSFISAGPPSQSMTEFKCDWL
jgi:hypothetical protein